MRTIRMLQWIALAAIFAAIVPAPASAQLGGFIKKKIKQQIIQQVMPASDTTPAAAAPASGGAAPAGGRAGRAVKSAPSAAPSGPVFTDYMLEMTSAVLDQLEKGLAAQAAEQKAVDRELANIKSKPAYAQCIQAMIASPEGQKAYQAYADAAQAAGNDMQKYQKAAEGVSKLMEAKCGPAPETRETLKTKLSNRPREAALAASGLTEGQFAVIKERVLPFCEATATGAAGARIAAGSSGMYLVYSPTEIQALTARCARLAPALKAAG